jgi:hypothetical protein
MAEFIVVQPWRIGVFSMAENGNNMVNVTQPFGASR